MLSHEEGLWQNLSQILEHQGASLNIAGAQTWLETHFLGQTDWRLFSLYVGAIADKARTPMPRLGTCT